jgi:hypothetical protein
MQKYRPVQNGRVPPPIGPAEIHERFTLYSVCDVLKLRLFISKRNELNDYSRKGYIRFVVVDLDRSKKYPANFVCILPKNIKPTGSKATKFEKMFEDESLELAKKLLKHALRAEEDWEVKAEIRKRLELLNPKPQNGNPRNRRAKFLRNKY